MRLPHQAAGQHAQRADPRPATITAPRQRVRRLGRAVTLQDPNATRVSAPGASVRITPGGNSESGSGHRRSPSGATSYS
jgi:hypothetical protein